MLGTKSNLLRGIAADPDNDKGEYLFGENVTKRISEFKTSIRTLNPPSTNTSSKKLLEKPEGEEHRVLYAKETEYKGFQEKGKQEVEKVSIINDNSMKMLKACMSAYKAGNIMHCYENWKKITKDTVILDIIHNGLKLDFETRPDQQYVIKMALSEGGKT